MVTKFSTMMVALAFVVSTAVFPSSGHGQSKSFSTPEEALGAAVALLGGEKLEDLEPSIIRQIRGVLDQIVDDFPSSDIAVRILFQDKIEALDVAELDRRIGDDLLESSSSEVVSSSSQAIELEALSDPVANDVVDTAGIDTTDVSSEMPGPSATADTADDRSAFVLSSFSDEFKEIAQTLNACYLGGRTEDENGLGLVAFSIDGRGMLDGVPELTNSKEAGEGVRMIYLNAMIALERCAPFSSRYLDRKLTAQFDRDRLVAIENTAKRELPWKEADSASQKALGLDRAAIANIQARLKVLGFDPNGIDGALGRGSRSAIAAWQTSKSIPSSGYLDRRQLLKLNEMSEAAFQTWALNPQNKSSLESASKPPPKAVQKTTRTNRGNPQGWYRDRRGLYCRSLGFVRWCQEAKPRNLR